MSFWANSMNMLIWRGVSIGVGTLSAILLARFMGPENRGEFAIIILTISMLALLMQFGIPETLVYLLGSKKHERGLLLSSAISFFLLIGLVVAAPLWLVLLYFDFEELHSLLICACVLTSMMLTLLRHIFLADKLFHKYNFSIVSELLVNIFLVCLFYLQYELSVTHALGAYTCSLVVSLIFTLILKPFNSTGVGLKLDKTVLTESLHRGKHYWFAGVGGFLHQRVNFYILNYFSGTKSVGLFTVANTFPTLLGNIPQQLSLVLYSHVSNEGDVSVASRLTVMIVKVTLLLTGLILIPFAYFAGDIVSMIFGDEFLGIETAMLLLVVSIAISGSASLVYNAFAGLGYQHYGSYMAVISIVCVTVVGLLLIPSMGIEGAAIAQCSAALINFAFMSIEFCRITRTNLLSFFYFTQDEIVGIKRLLQKFSRRPDS